MKLELFTEAALSGWKSASTQLSPFQILSGLGARGSLEGLAQAAGSASSVPTVCMLVTLVSFVLRPDWNSGPPNTFGSL